MGLLSPHRRPDSSPWANGAAGIAVRALKTKSKAPLVICTDDIAQIIFGSKPYRSRAERGGARSPAGWAFFLGCSRHFLRSFASTRFPPFIQCSPWRAHRPEFHACPGWPQFDADRIWDMIQHRAGRGVCRQSNDASNYEVSG